MSRCRPDGTSPVRGHAAPRANEGSATSQTQTRNLQRRNVEAIAKVEAAVLGERSRGERIGRWCIRTIGTPRSVVIHLAVFAGWIVWNGTRGRAWAFDPYPFPLLSLGTCLEAIMLGLLILTSQNRLQHEADRRAHLNLQINMMAEVEGTKVLEMLHGLCRHFGVESEAEHLLEELKSETDPEAIVASIKASMPVEE